MTSAGAVIALGVGTATISATSEGKTGTANIVVTTSAAIPLAGGTIYANARRAAFVGGPVTDEIVAVNPSTGAEINLTNNPGSDEWPSVSPDGQHILFRSDRNFLNANRQLLEPMLMRRDGGQVTRLPYTCARPELMFAYCAAHESWLGDGRLRFLVDEINAQVQQVTQVHTMTPINGTPTVWSLAPSAFVKLRARALLSPTGSFEAYTRDAGLYVMSVPSGQETLLAGPCAFVGTCIAQPVWSPDGQRLYVLRQAVLMEFNVQGGASRQLHAAASLSDLTIAPDGSAIAFIEAGALRLLRLTGTPSVSTLFSPISQGSSNPIVAFGPLAWAPNSRSLAFLTGNSGIGSGNELVAVNSDGTGRRMLILVGYNSSGIAWGP